MTTVTLCAMLLTPIKPISYALLILAISIAAASITFSTFLTSWIPFVLILVFSSGMMTLFIYIASLTTKEKKSNRLMKATFTLLLLNPILYTPMKLNKQQMKSFSQQSLILFMTLTLILTMLTVSSQSFNPQQSMASTF